LIIFPFFSENSLNIYPKIEGTHHDFTINPHMNEDNLCRVCHTPHHANTDVINSPLWNHALTSASYQIYTSPTIDATIGQPSGTSKLCLSCHDGTVAIDSYGGRNGTNHMMSWHMGYLGTDLKNDHPISFEYNSALAAADKGLEDPSIASSGLGGTIEEDLLFNGRLECSSCHDVHVSRNTQGCNGCHNMGGGAPFLKQTLSLRVDNTNSAFCLTCHKK